MTEPVTKARLKPLMPVVLAGGVGKRLWPLSRALFPKQFHALFGERSLLQDTLSWAALTTDQPPIIVCNETNRFLVAEQLRALDRSWQCIALEPEGRNTAPAIALAAHLALAKAEDAHLLVLPADHLIDDPPGFANAVQIARPAAERGMVVTFGITPARPETGYGYIELSAEARQGVQPIQTFIEKPDEERAHAFVASGRHLWNSGMFLVDARVALTETERYNPEVARAVAESVQAGSADLHFFRPGDTFLRSPAVSFDVAVMENTDRAAVLPVDFGWRDLGSWEAVLEASGVDEQGNHFVGDALAVDVAHTLIHSNHRLVSALGVDNLIVVETADAVLIADRNRVQDVRELVERLESADRSEHLLHTRVFRPWGSYEGIGRGERHQVKRIQVNPGASISLQLHRHRAEHWVVVRGLAEVTCGEKTFALHKNESTYIPQGAKHRLRNAGHQPLEIIEIQVGDYLGEDDIIRFDDQYGREQEGL